jgi:glyoxylase-like metal-dependent hydrolase (beta-lactamase superfamily II)
LKSAGATLFTAELTGSPTSAAPSFSGPAVDFVPSGGLTQISPNLYLLRDTCNVYVLKNSDRALLIDFGSGHILSLLGQIGVTKVEGILHTHHHRDQCQGDGQAVAQRIPLYVPAHERHFFEDAESFWHSRRVFENYYVRNDFFTLTRNLPLTGVLHDYEKFRWGPYEFLILPTPGHTVGAISLLGDVDGKKVAFSGDLIHSPGKVVNLYELQYQYGSFEGVDLAISSLTSVAEHGPDLVCPSHGEPFAGVEKGIADLLEGLKGWYHLEWTRAGGGPPTVENKLLPVSPHLVCADQTCSTFYAVISDSGKALFVDYGSASLGFFGSLQNATATVDRIRFLEHSIPELKARYGLKSIDVIMPSHMHDDHLNGFPHLVRHYGAKVWCFENMVDVLQNPRGYNLGCILGEPFKVDRAIRQGETFKWEEFEFTVVHSPGHTEYQMAMFVTVDSTKVAFTGDAVFPTADPHSRLRHNLIFRNWVENDSHLKSLRAIFDHEPALIAPGHGKPYKTTAEDVQNLKLLLEKQQQYFFTLIADPNCDFGLNPSWVRLYPYQIIAKAGSSVKVELRVRNYRATPMHLQAALVLPAGWKATPPTLALEASPRSDSQGSFTVTIPQAWDRAKPRVGIAADIVANDQYLGQIAEGVVEVQVAGKGRSPIT